MAARGNIAKEEVKATLLSTFEGAFIGSDGKTLRIPIRENGELIEIKVTLTAAKDLEGGDSSISAPVNTSAFAFGGDADSNVDPAEPTKEELERVEKLLSFF